MVSDVRIIHEGRGGYIEIDGRRYPIELVEGGQFAIHFPRGRRARGLAEDRAQLDALVAREPEKWAIE
jgi:hypothetical protein